MKINKTIIMLLIVFSIAISFVSAASIIQIRRDIASAWSTSNPILAQGEMGLETDTLKLKFGNGTGTWNALPYYSTDLFDPSGYYTMVEIDSQNLTMTEFILYVNSTNGAGSGYTDNWINVTIDAKDVTANTSMKDYVDSLNGTWQDNSDNLTEQNIADFGFLKFLNLTSYITNLNTSWVNTLIDNRVTQAFVQVLGLGFYTKDEVYNSTEIDNLNGTWEDLNTIYNDDWINTTTNISIIDKIIIANTSMKDYTDNLNGTWQDNSDNLTGSNVIEMVGNWSADKGDYSTTTEANLLYAPTGYGDEWNKTYADTLYLTSYENLTDADILALGYNHTADLTAYFNTLYSNSTDTNETTRVDTLVNQVASMENLSMVEVAANTTGYGYITSYDNLSGDNVVGMVGNWSAWDNITGIPHATPSNSDITHFSLADEIYDWVIGLGYSTTVGTVTSVTGTSPIVSSGGATPAISATILKDLVTTAPLTGAVDNVFVGTDSDITLTITMGGDLVTTAPLTGGVLNIFPGSGTKATIAMPVATTSADGYLDKDDWNTFNNKADSDTTYSAGNGISEALTVFSVAGGTALTQDAGGLSVTDGGIGDTQIADAYINQALTTTSDVTHADVTVNNITSVNCIYFDSGGKICSGS